MDIDLKELKKTITMLEMMDESMGIEYNDNLYERYKTEYVKDNIVECIMLLLRMGKQDVYNFKKSMLLSNAILNPIGMKFTAKDYAKTMNVLTYAYRLSEEDSDEFKKVLIEFMRYTQILYENNKLNTIRLQKSQFFKYSLSKQLRMLYIYIQDQSRLMYKRLYDNNDGYITGMESELAKYSVDYYPQQKTSLEDNYEGILEFINKLISYLYYVKKADFKLDDVNTHGDINHFHLPEFSEIFVLAQQRRMYEQFEEKFRYSLWNLRATKKGDKTVYFLKSSNEKKTIANLILIQKL